jgi:hypothetical protein
MHHYHAESHTDVGTAKLLQHGRGRVTADLQAVLIHEDPELVDTSKPGVQQVRKFQLLLSSVADEYILSPLVGVHVFLWKVSVEPLPAFCL